MALLKKLNKSKELKTQSQLLQPSRQQPPSIQQAYEKSRYKPSVEQPSQYQSASMRGKNMHLQTRIQKTQHRESKQSKRQSEAPKKIQLNREMASKYLSNAQMNQKNNIFGFVLGTKRVADIVLVQLLNFDNRTVFISMPEDHIERLENLQYLCLKKVVLYQDDGKQCGMATKKQLEKAIYNDD